MNILLLEDNDSIREAVASFLTLEDYNVIETSTVIEAKEYISNNIDLYLLDIMLPDGNGYLLAKDIRKEYETPIIFLTAKESESERIKGFEVGADDYITKPFSLKELTLRVKAILKRTSNNVKRETNDLFSLNNHSLEIDMNAHILKMDTVKINLTQTEWEILIYLVENRGVVLSKERILEGCLGYSRESSDRVVITHIKNLREKLGGVNWIETVRGFGYRFLGEN